MSLRNHLIVLLALSGCTAPPPAPEGLDASATYLLREFYADDATFAAGVQGFMNWYHDEGVAMMGTDVNAETVGAFALADLSEADVAFLQLPTELDVDGETIPRDLARAKGVVSMAELDCDWKLTEDFLVRGDQHVVFPSDWEDYERTYVTPRDVFQAATEAGDIPAVRERIDPFAADFDPTRWQETFLFTENRPDPKPFLLIDVGAYDLHFDVRHGTYTIDGEELGVFSVITYMPQPALNPGGGMGILQSYTMEINVQRPQGRTLRLMAAWAEPLGGGIEPDSALALSTSVSKSRAASQRLSDVCAGRATLEP